MRPWRSTPSNLPHSRHRRSFSAEARDRRGKVVYLTENSMKDSPEHPNAGPVEQSLLAASSDIRAELGAVRSLLEDFDDIAGKVLLPYDDPEELEPGLRTVILARRAGNKSLDYTKQRYVDGAPRFRKHGKTEALQRAYVAAYFAAKCYIAHIRRKLEPRGTREPTCGEFGASVVLQRLVSSFFCAHLMYRLGHRYEAHSVSRHILEQIAWAHSAAAFTELGDIERIITTKTVTKLSRFFPDMGRLYGLLSQDVHLDYSGHSQFLGTDGEFISVRYAQEEFLAYGQVILTLADAYGAVYEATQVNFIHQPEAIVMRDGALQLNQERPFLDVIRQHVDAIKAAAAG
jgi:hypothetical protein